MNKWIKTLLIAILMLFSTDIVAQERWLNNWTASDNLQSAYGKGRFFYRISRTQSPVNAYNQYMYKIYFISDSYYPGFIYDTNKNGVIDGNEYVYRASTKIDNMKLYVDNKPYINVLTKTNNFWILFKGNYEKGIGDVCVIFYTKNPNARIGINWTQPKVY
jgi:hypothetical protein